MYMHGNILGEVAVVDEEEEVFEEVARNDETLSARAAKRERERAKLREVLTCKVRVNDIRTGIL